MLAAIPCRNFSIVAVLDRKQVLIIGGTEQHDDYRRASKKVFVLHTNAPESTRYPDMPTAQYKPTCISYQSCVIVAGGIIDWRPNPLTGSSSYLKI